MTKTPSDPHNPGEARTDSDEARTDAALRHLKARGQWPQPSNPAPPAPQHAPALWLAAEPVTPYPSARPSCPSASIQPAPRPRSAWRSVGIGALGLVGGVLLALIVQDLLATVFLRDGTIPIPVALVLGFLMPAFGVLGVVIAILIDNRNAKRRSEAPIR